MNNAELVEALRYCSDNEREEGCDECPYLHNGICHTMLSDAAYALEAADKRIAELESNIPIVESVLVDKLNQRIAELEARLPKEGEWIHGRELGKEWLYDH